GPGEQRIALINFCARQAPFEQLAHYAECEVRLKLRSSSTQNVVVKFFCTLTGHFHQRRFADARPALDKEDSTSALQQRVDRCQLTLTLEQLLHEMIIIKRWGLQRCCGEC